ncbi:putative glycerol kinase 5 isoform X2 [Planococcus citri]|uniref:putative glycerol kinase 5 isoform X2 n=1 Tax=Planococcus citri TaxID=170843 RepID=UPI0031F77C10
MEKHNSYCSRIIQNVIFTDSNVLAKQIACMGISCQRNTFITWDRDSLRPFHNFITWKDMRSESLVQSWNNSFFIKVIKWICYFIYLFTGNERYLAASLLTFANVQVTMRLLWQLENNEELKEALKNGTVMFGTLDTWLMYRLTKGNVYQTDISCASATGLYDPFLSKWASFTKMLNIPVTLLPNVCDSAGSHLGYVSPEIWGSPIRITCSMADQSASFYGSCCFFPGDVKLTLGTGAFLDINVGSTPVVSRKGFYPLVSWKYKGEKVYVLEGACHDCGTVINWAQSIGLFSDVNELNEIVAMESDTDNVFFIPAFSGLQIPINDASATSGFIGIKQSTSKSQMVRAVLESIVFQIYDLYSVYKSESKLHSKSFIRVDGGVSKNDFICQSIADMCEVFVRRPNSVEMSARGVAHLAGLAAGLCKDYDVLNEMESSDVVFEPKIGNKQYLFNQFATWKKAQRRFTKWYQK